MALNYTQVFGDLGKLIARINSYNSLAATTLITDFGTLVTQFGTRWLPEEGIASTYENFKDAVTGWRETLGQFADQRLLDYSTVLTPLSLAPGAGIADVLPKLKKQMGYDGQNVKACSCTLGAMAALAGNTGNGQGFVTLTLDGYNPPVLGAAPDVLYNGLASQFCVPSETMILECVADSATDGLAEGAEQWSWTGGPFYGPLDYRAEGSGPGPNVQTANGALLVSNGDFELWAGGAPSGWTVESGAALLSQETTPANVYRNTSSVKIVGDGATTFRISQPVSPSQLNSRRSYFGGIAAKASVVSAGASLAVYLTGTNPLSQPQFASLAGSQFPTAWTPYGGFGVMPAPMPADWRIVVEVKGLGLGVSLWLDSLSFTPTVYHGGVGLAIAGGSSRWLRGDRLQFTAANDGAGLFQTFFRRHWQVQLPSVNDSLAQGYLPLPFQLMPATATEAISDSLVS